jgi:hypothetical protein
MRFDLDNGRGSDRFSHDCVDCKTGDPALIGENRTALKDLSRRHRSFRLALNTSTMVTALNDLKRTRKPNFFHLPTHGENPVLAASRVVQYNRALTRSPGILEPGRGRVGRSAGLYQRGFQQSLEKHEKIESLIRGHASRHGDDKTRQTGITVAATPRRGCGEDCRGMSPVLRRRRSEVTGTHPLPDAGDSTGAGSGDRRLRDRHPRGRDRAGPCHRAGW